MPSLIKQTNRTKSTKQWLLVITIAFFLLSSTIHANPLAASDNKVVAEAKELVNTMISNVRGPYQRIRWFCKDGTTLPPKAFACKEHGGGRQHAEYSKERQRLAELGWHVGTIFAALTWEELWSENNRHQRLRELPLENYLTQIDDGWVLRQARYYRGRVQIEDEEAYGHELLLKLLNDPVWIDNNFLLVRELVKVIPHSGGEDLTQMIRRTAQNLAEEDTTFEKLRIELHSNPSSNTAEHIRNWITNSRSQKYNTKVLNEAESLAQQLDNLYGKSGRAKRLQSAAKILSQHRELEHLTYLIIKSDAETPMQTLQRLSSLLEKFRSLITKALNPKARLQVLDTYSDIEAELRLTASEILMNYSLTRKEALEVMNALLYASYGTGLLTKREFGLLDEILKKLLVLTEVSAEEYYEASRIFNLANNWVIGSVRYTFAESLLRYTALNSKAAKFAEDIIRGSVMFPYAEVARHISLDAQTNIGIQHLLFNEPATALLGLNPGLAIGKLRIVTDEDLSHKVTLSRDEVVVLPQTVSELPPVAGVLTYGEGNLLSHVQMLARNFGIPNVALTTTNPSLFQKMEGQDVVLIVGTDSSVMLQSLKSISEDIRELLTTSQAKPQLAQLEVPSPDLSIDTPIAISELHKELSGKIVGPKAANLGELNRLFPGRVAPALALPFGVYAKHVNINQVSAKTRIKDTFEKYRNNGFDEQELIQHIESIRTDITKIKISSNLQAQLIPMMQSLFGEPGSYGLFIRSDTNVEDLPGFTGAGLSETVANVVGLDMQMATIPRVWSSVLSPRAIAWRSNLLKKPEEVYASVLLMKSVAAEKSGVLVTSDLFAKGQGITVSTAWGVGGAVSGEAAETIVLLEDGTELLVSEAKTPYQRQLASQGGITWLPAADGAVLTADEKQQLLGLSIEVNAKYQSVRGPNNQLLPWDIEFGFVNGELTLFQIRPLIERGQALADKVLAQIVGKRQIANHTVSLNEAF